MPTIPDGAKKPQDRKAADGGTSTTFRFEHDGETYETADIAAALTPGFIRKHRRLEEVDFTYTVLEEVADARTLDVLDNMTWADNRVVMKAFEERIGKIAKVSLGE